MTRGSAFASYCIMEATVCFAACAIAVSGVLLVGNALERLLCWRQVRLGE